MMDILSVHGPFAGRVRSVVPYRCWSRIHNLGDAITPLILKEALGIDGISASKGAPHLLSIGSIFALATPSSIVWGAGVMNPDQPISSVQAGSVRAVRGKLTASALRNNGISVDVPLGDPGIFAAMLSGGRERQKPVYRLAVIPHHSGIDSPIYDALRENPEIRLVDLRDQSLVPLYDIASSEIVLSESLHGLIFAEALGKPSVWYSTKASAYWNFKFQDWFSTTKNPDAQPVQNTPETAADWFEMAKAARLHGDIIDHSALLGAFPWELVSESNAPLIDVAQCRKRSPVRVSVPNSEPQVQSYAALEWTEFRTRLGATAKMAMANTRKAFDGFAEWQYHTVNFGDAQPWSSLELERAIALMNKFAGLDCVAIQPIEALSDLGADIVIDRSADILFSRSFVPAQTLMFRPNKNFNTAGSAATIFL